MFPAKDDKDKSVNFLGSVLRIFLPIVLVGCAVAFLFYRTGILRWQIDISWRESEFALLLLCILLLLGLLFAACWRFVRAQVAEQAMRSSLAHSEARLKSLFQTIPDLIWLKDVHGNYLNCNRAFESFFGKTEQEIVGRTDYDFVPPELAAEFRKNDSAALQAGQPRANEEWITFASDGRRALLETIKVPVKTEDGQVLGVLGISRDITRRHEAEKNVAMFRRLIELSHDPIYILDANDHYRMVFANQAACRHFGASLEEIQRWHVTDWDPAVTPEDLERISIKIQRGEGMVFESRHRVASGDIVPVEISVNELWYDGKLLYVGYIRDISERKRAEEALRKGHQQLIDLTSNVPGVVYQYRLSPDGHFSFPFISNRLEKMCGLSPGSVYADPALIFSFVYPDDLEMLQASLLASAQTLHHWRHEFRATLPKYGLRWLLCVSQPERQPDGSTVWHGVITDITDIKRIEAELNRSREQLRQLVAHQDQIREDERKHLAGEIHDELGQHLLALKIDVSMLAPVSADPSLFGERLGDIMRHIDETVNKVRAIINNIRPSVLDLGLFAALDWQLKEFERRNGILCELVGNEAELQLDERMATTLFRVMQEALTNVQRHAQATSVHVEVRCDGDRLIMSVADNGVGLSSSDHEDKFGLVGMQERISMLGGQTSIESQEGTLLTISLPVHKPMTAGDDGW